MTETAGTEFDPALYIQTHRELLQDGDVITTGARTWEMQGLLPIIELETRQWLDHLQEFAVDEGPYAAECREDFVAVASLFAVVSDRASRKGLEEPSWTCLPVAKGRNVISELFEQYARLRQQFQSNEGGVQERLRAPGMPLYFSPEEVSDWHDKYSAELGEGLVYYAIGHSPLHVGEFLEKTAIALAELEVEMGGEFNRGEIRSAVRHSPTDPKDFLVRARERLEKLTEKYRDELDPWTIRQVVLSYPGQSEQEIQRIITTSKTLELVFGQSFGIGIIHHVVARTTRDPAAVLRNAAEEIERLSEEFGDTFLPGHIRKMAIHHPKNARERLQQQKADLVKAEQPIS